VLIPYKFLIPLLVFVLLTGVVIGDRLAAEAQFGSAGDGRSGSCSGLASARLHNCVHRLGSLRTPDGWPGRTGGASGCPGCQDRWPRGRDTACGFDGDERDARGRED
jgi:hypothetical protein